MRKADLALMKDLVEAGETAVDYLLRTMAIAHEERDLLRSVAALHPWCDEYGINVCTFCMGSWEHKPDCLWGQIRGYLGMPVEE